MRVCVCVWFGRAEGEYTPSGKLSSQIKISPSPPSPLSAHTWHNIWRSVTRLLLRLSLVSKDNKNASTRKIFWLPGRKIMLRSEPRTFHHSVSFRPRRALTPSPSPCRSKSFMQKVYFISAHKHTHTHTDGEVFVFSVFAPDRSQPGFGPRRVGTSAQTAFTVINEMLL